jgi:hypothetical protein
MNGQEAVGEVSSGKCNKGGSRQLKRLHKI